jgi:hypothetical protein
MPEYHLDTQGTVNLPPPTAFNDLDGFTRGYIEALFFTSECPQVDTREFRTKRHQRAMESGSADGVLPCDVGFDDLAPNALATIMDECRTFQETNAATLALAYDHVGCAYDEECAGRDYWYSRNGHGVGFWDRGLGPVGDALHKAARYHEVNPYFGDDGLVYLE